LASRGLTVADVEAALREQNIELPAGYLEGQQSDYTIRVQRGYTKASDFANLPVRGGTQGYVTRLGDVARIERGASDPRRFFRGNGQDQVALGVVRQSVANDLEISKEMRKRVEEVNKTLPKGTQLLVAVDNSVFTAEALKEVWITLAIALGLVGFVNLVFLGSWRAALVPTIVAPICIAATFIVLGPLGFSINLLTLLALVLAIGLVVDDAIVVTENIQRRIDEGEPPAVAAVRGTRQVYFAVIATTLVLIAVFGPLMFLPGYIGRLFVELAVAIAAAVAFSSLLALSLSPMMASKLLRPVKSSPLTRLVDGAMHGLQRSYEASLRMLVRGVAGPLAVSALLVLIGGAVFVMWTSVPQELVPPEDRGRIDVSINGPEGAGFAYTREAAIEAEKILSDYIRSGEAYRYVVGLPRGGNTQMNGGFGVLVLEDWHKRGRSADEITEELNRRLSRITSARVNASVRGPFQRGPGGGGAGNSVELVALGADYKELANWTEQLMAAARDNSNLSRVRTNYEPTAPRVVVDMNADAAVQLGVPPERVGRALETMFGSRRVTTFTDKGQEYDVLLQSPLDQRRGLEDLNTLYVRANTGALVPLSAVTQTRITGDAADRRRVDRQRSVQVSADLAPGYALADAMSFLQAEANKLPPVAAVTWGGNARDLQQASGAVMFAFALALLIVFLVLAAQFESFIHPFIIMLTVPLAACGGLFGLLMAGSSLNIYSQIGLIILIGVAAKNGILIVEFANQLRDEGKGVVDAVIEAAGVRLRPILMTSLATALGALPLAVWEGAGAGSRQTIGVVIFSGALFATILTVFVLPVIYALLARFTRSPEHTARQIEAWEAQHTAD
ncbi:MAG: efflux RND transporter permease subunit, partial [Asticcacaulis sp.]